MTEKNVIDNVCIIEDTNDFKLMHKRFDSDKNLFVPLNIETYILCKKKNLRIFDFNKFLNNEFHIRAVNETLNFTKNINFLKKIHYSLKSEIIGFLRFRLHSVILIIEIIEVLINKFQVRKIVVSGFKEETHSLQHSKICSEIIEILYPDKAFFVLDKIKKEKNVNIHEYFSKGATEKNKKICISNVGYNFKRVINFFKKKNYQIFIPNFEKISFINKVFYFFNKVKVIDFYKNKKINIKKLDFIDKINFVYKKKYDLSLILNSFYRKLNYHFNDLNQKITALKKFINNNDFNLTISNISRGLDGSILDSDMKGPTLCIPHGVISESFNNDDVIYKKIIAEGVFNGESKYFAIQSKIIQNSLKTHKINGKSIITGNLVFAQNNKNYKNKKIYLLYATTLKGFKNLQYLGVDMFYEYWEIMKKLNSIAENSKEKILVKVHPEMKHCKNDLMQHFKYLKFSNDRIENLLKDALALITLSSGTIEDALNSRVPVILFDLKNRYKQMKCSETIENNKAVYYINDENKIEIVLNKIKNSTYADFENYIYEENFEKKFLPLIEK
tara:strand:+ start:2041 stop:3714 length:1674 start_codon:yes stop_codon:yes gene_type:complete